MGFELIANRCRCYNPRPNSAFFVGLSAEDRKVESFETLSALCMYGQSMSRLERDSTCSETLHVESVSPISSCRDSGGMALHAWIELIALL